MAQMAQVGTVRNTRLGTVKKSRNWCFTLNNYTLDDIGTLTQSSYQYIFQEEKGENGTAHLQGLLCSNNAVSFNSIKKLIPRAHIEACKNKNASINYCKKGESRCGKIYTNVESWMVDNCINDNKLPNPGPEWDIWVRKNCEEFLKEIGLWDIEATELLRRSVPSSSTHVV